MDGKVFEWSEPLTPTREDVKVGFNRGEYLRTIQRTDPDCRLVYGRQQYTESLNAQLEYKFHKNRLPAGGLNRQTLAILGAALAQKCETGHPEAGTRRLA